MGKSYCKECDSEINEDVDICPKCGKPINNEEENSDWNKIKNNNTISVEKKETNEKSSYKQTFTSKKKFLTLTGICIILFIIVVMTFGFPNLTAEHKGEYNKDNSLLSPSFTDNIGGIDFKIPKGYGEIDGANNEEIENLTSCDRSYINSAGNIIWICVSTNYDYFYWQLSQKKKNHELNANIKGHEGILSSDGKFIYIANGTLITITGANKTELETIITN